MIKTDFLPSISLHLKLTQMIIQFCGLSGSGKSTLATVIEHDLKAKNIPIEIIDGDEYRKALCADLGFSKDDRNENIRRLAFVAGKLAAHGIIVIICAINPYEDVRQEVISKYKNVKTVFVDCAMDLLLQRDTKGLYKKALLPKGHPDKISNLTGVNDPFEIPAAPDLTINTTKEPIEISVNRLLTFILANYKSA